MIIRLIDKLFISVPTNGLLILVTVCHISFDDHLMIFRIRQYICHFHFLESNLADMAFAGITKSSMENDLLKVSAQCMLRGLTNTMKWSSELLNSLTTDMDETSAATKTSSVSLMDVIGKDELLNAEINKYFLGKACFDSKEFARAAFHLKGTKSSTCIFLYYYSRFLEVEKKKRYHMVDVLNEKVNEKKEFQEMVDLRNDLKQAEDQLDAYGLYVYGMVLKNLNLHQEAINTLVASVHLHPINWGAWLELVGLSKDRPMLKDLQLPKHWMTEIFHAHAELELHMNEEALSRYQEISNAGFAMSTYVKSQVATALYNIRDFDVSVEQFKEVYEADPYMLENIDTYSNILYIQDDRAELSYLAQHACEVDRYRAESCGVIGNYYSLRGDHEKGVLYFKQALRINPNYVAAWTLLGHEHVQLRNTNAAIESYRRATEINSSDYRAWYGLGQMYEILKMPFYSLNYFREAQKKRPNDARMIIALGVTYQYIEKNNEAKKCFMKAIRLGDSEGQATVKLAKLLENSGELEEAAKLHQMNLARFETVNRQSEDLAKSCLFLARHHMKHERYDEATVFARKATDYVESREQAKTLLFEISLKASKSLESKKTLNLT